MFINVDKLIFKKLEKRIVDNSNTKNTINTSYPHIYKFVGIYK